jgi:ATP-dependent Clp protease ATP-binding subunit ClpC
VQKRIRFIVERMEASIANHEFEKARFYSGEERKERDNLKQLREKYRLDDNPALNIRREDIERAVISSVTLRGFLLHGLLMK